MIGKGSSFWRLQQFDASFSMSLAIDLSGRAAIVTGGRRGIGQPVALALAQAGADVSVTARTLAEIEETAGMVRERGRKWITVPGDATRSAVAAEVVTKTIADLRGLHILVNNAGRELPKALIDTTEDEYDRVMATNVKSLVHARRLYQGNPEAADRRAGRDRFPRCVLVFRSFRLHDRTGSRHRRRADDPMRLLPMQE
jgi:NAD(P)-dependent dehydrogenase (short-subunit alcohol dehydrogenase family)